MKELQRLRRVWCWGSRSRFRSSMACGTRCSPSFVVTLSHSSRTFHHKTSPVPPPKRLENFRVATAGQDRRLAAAAVAAAANLSTNPSSLPWLKLQKIRETSISIHGFRRLYSHSTSSSKSPTNMAEVEWTGLKVRQTFFDFFAERGHTIG